MSRVIESTPLKDLLPSSISRDKGIQNLAISVDGELKHIHSDLQRLIIYANIDQLPLELVDCLGWQFKVDFWRSDAPLPLKRNLVKGSIAWHRKKGTKWAVKKVIRDAGLDPEVYTAKDVEGTGLYPMLDHWAKFVVVVPLNGDEPANCLANLKPGVYIAKPERSWPVFYLKWENDIELEAKVCANSVWSKDICILYPWDETLLDGTWVLGDGEEKLLESSVIEIFCRILSTTEICQPTAADTEARSIKSLASPLEVDGNWLLGWEEIVD